MTDVYVYRLKKNYTNILRDLEPRQVLGYLYQEDVIDGDDKDEIRAERTRKKQAELLLSMLERRGDIGIQKLVEGLQISSQKYLAEILKKPVENEKSSDDISKHVVNLNDNTYPMTRDPCGIAVIINNMVFEESPLMLRNRQGSMLDVSKMKMLFTSLRFEVSVHYDFTASKIKETARTLSLEDHSKYDCFVLFLMSHGYEEGIFGTDNEKVSLWEIKAYFTASNCPTLAGKPKLFFVQACRGQRADRGVVVTEGPIKDNARPFQETNSVAPTTNTNSTESAYSDDVIIPNVADTFTGFASTPSHAALRNTETGSWFVDHFFEVMTSYAGQRDLVDMMTMVTDKVAERTTKHYLMQCPHFESNLRKKLRFKPK